MPRRATVGALGLVLLIAVPRAAPAQGAPPAIDIYRYVLDIEVPESPALVALGLAPAQALAATSPKPLAASLAAGMRPDGRFQGAAAVEVSPYYLLGGGIRDPVSYAANSVAGRLARVGTKTVLSLGIEPAGAGGPTRVALALRATLHDPHDPVNNSELPAQVAGTLDTVPPLDDEDVADLSPEVRRLFAATARTMRARRRIVVSAGLGVAAPLAGGVLAPDSLGGTRQTLWTAWQYTLGPRFDVLLTGLGRQGAGEAAYVMAALGLRRKSARGDLLLDLAVAGHGGLGGDAALEAHLARGVRATVGLGAAAAPEAGRPAHALRLRAALRWSSGD